MKANNLIIAALVSAGLAFGVTAQAKEKEGANFEAVIEKNGKQTGIEIDANGKVVSRHNESKEHKEKGEKGEKY